MGNHHRSKRVTECVYCGNSKRHEARGLCKCCYNHIREGRVQGVTLNNFPLIGQYHGVTYLDPEPMRAGNDAARMRRLFDLRFIPNREAS